MRIALVTEELLAGSTPAARVVGELAGRLTGAGQDVLLVAAGRGPATHRDARVLGASRMTSVATIRQALSFAVPDVVHLVDPHRIGLKVAEAAEQLGVPTVYLSPETWAPGVDPNEHHPRMRDAELHHRWTHAGSPDGGRLVVGFVGDPAGRKVLARLRRIAGLPGVHLVVLGSGPAVDSLREAGAEVVPAASAVERARCLATFDVLVQPRKKAVYAPEVLEALASGVPVVTFARAAAVGVQHEHNGLLVDPDRGAKSFARAVARLAASPGLRHTLSGQARGSVLHRTWDDAVSELLDVHYPRVLDRSPRAVRSG